MKRTVRLRHALALIMAATGLLLAGGCARSESTDSVPKRTETPAPTFSDGLTAQDIIDKSDQADADVSKVRFRSSSVVVVQKSDRTVTILEGITVGDNAYARTVEGTGPAEILVYDGESYIRDSPGEEWQAADPVVQQLTRAVEEIFQHWVDRASASGERPTLNRVLPEGAGGDSVFVIDAEFPDGAFDFKKAFDDVLKAFQEALPEAEDLREYPDKFLPDDWTVRGRIVIGREDFHLYSLSVEYAGEIEGETFINGKETYNFWDHNAELELPGPLP